MQPGPRGPRPAEQEVLETGKPKTTPPPSLTRGYHRFVGSHGIASLHVKHAVWRQRILDSMPPDASCFWRALPFVGTQESTLACLQYARDVFPEGLCHDMTIQDAITLLMETTTGDFPFGIVSQSAVDIGVDEQPDPRFLLKVHLARTTQRSTPGEHVGSAMLLLFIDDNGAFRPHWVPVTETFPRRRVRAQPCDLAEVSRLTGFDYVPLAEEVADEVVNVLGEWENWFDLDEEHYQGRLERARLQAVELQNEEARAARQERIRVWEQGVFEAEARELNAGLTPLTLWQPSNVCVFVGEHCPPIWTESMGVSALYSRIFHSVSGKPEFDFGDAQLVLGAPSAATRAAYRAAGYKTAWQLRPGVIEQAHLGSGDIVYVHVAAATITSRRLLATGDYNPDELATLYTKCGVWRLGTGGAVATLGVGGDVYKFYGIKRTATGIGGLIARRIPFLLEQVIGVTWRWREEVLPSAADFPCRKAWLRAVFLQLAGGMPDSLKAAFLDQRNVVLALLEEGKLPGDFDPVCLARALAQSERAAKQLMGTPGKALTLA